MFSECLLKEGCSLNLLARSFENITRLGNLLKTLGMFVKYSDFSDLELGPATGNKYRNMSKYCSKYV